MENVMKFQICFLHRSEHDFTLFDMSARHELREIINTIVTKVVDMKFTSKEITTVNICDTNIISPNRMPKSFGYCKFCDITVAEKFAMKNEQNTSKYLPPT